MRFLLKVSRKQHSQIWLSWIVFGDGVEPDCDKKFELNLLMRHYTLLTIILILVLCKRMPSTPLPALPINEDGQLLQSS